MSVRINLGSGFQPHIGNREAVEVEGATMRECLSSLTRKYPEIKNMLFDENGKLLALIVRGQRLIRQDDIDAAVVDGDEISLIAMISGG